MLKKRIPTPKTGPKGRAYELCHLAWRAGLVKRWHLMEDHSWSLELHDGAGRRDGLTVTECAALVADAIAVEGLELAREAKGSDHERYELAESLKSELEEAMPDLGGSMWSDLLNAAWSEVDWYEIADHYLQQVEEEASS